MKKTILHIPHASTHFPNYNSFSVNKTTLVKEANDLTDHFTDDLFIHKNTIPVIAPFSRIFCDVERFRSDEQETMAKLGMGAAYTHLENGKVMRNVSPEEREEILQNHYDVHHQKLTFEVEKQLDSYGKALIIDCHSFPNIPHQRNLDKKASRPDICIGTDSFHTPVKLLHAAVEYFESAGFSVKVNSPYKGTIVPLKHYGKENRVSSIMIEVNRKLYLTENFEKSSHYELVKEICQGFVKRKF